MQTKIMRPEVAVIVLTRNAGRLWPDWLKGIQQQTVQAGRYLVVDSESTDHTVALAHAANLDVVTVSAKTFNHGGTRQLAADLCADAQFLVYMTQDAILKQADSLERLLAEFNDDKVGLVFGRHIPRADADLIEQHARSFTYPPQASVQERDCFKSKGYRAAFSSDVYAAYRVTALRSIGGFPQHIIVSEDSYVAARLLLTGWKSVYAADSTVEHSHRYSFLQVFRRYFDVGVFHATEAPLMRLVGKPDKEAGHYVRSLIRFLSASNKWLLPKAGLQTLIRLLGFRLGQHYQRLPLNWCKAISVQKAYWQGVQPGVFLPYVPQYLATSSPPLIMPFQSVLSIQGKLTEIDSANLDY